MAISVTFYNLSKRVQSTKRPEGEGASLSVLLKNPTSIYSPVFEIELGSMPAWNYCVWDNRYYWVNDITSYRNNLWQISCEIDALATCKSDITNTNAFVCYAESSWDLLIPDPRTVMRTSMTNSSSIYTFPLLNSTGTYFLATVGEDTNSNGFTNYYALSQGNISQLASMLLNEDSVMVQLKEYFASALETIVGCIWIPVTYSTSGTTVKLGKFDTGVTAGAVTDNYLDLNVAISPEWKGNFLDFEPYRKMSLFLPGVGLVNISPADLKRSALSVWLYVDLHTGQCAYRVDAAENATTIGTFTGNLGSVIPVASYQRPVGEIISSGISTWANIQNVGISAAGATLGVMTGGLGGVGSAVTSVGSALTSATVSAANLGMACLTKTPSVVGGFGGYTGAAQGLSARMIVEDFSPSESVTGKLHVAGLPLFKTSSLGNFTGYVQTAGVSVEGNWPRDLLNYVNGMLDGGVWIE